MTDEELENSFKRYADLRNANLQYANLTYADLKNTNLNGAKLFGGIVESFKIKAEDKK